MLSFQSFVTTTVLALAWMAEIQAFAPGPTGMLSSRPTQLQQQQQQGHAMIPQSFLDASITDSSNLLERVSNNLLLATIDADIDSIPDDQFGLVFAGGIVVMLGGVLSALIVGFLLERGDLYAGLAAESYLQSADDEEFWKGLSEEERTMTQDMLKKINASKNADGASEATAEDATRTAVASTSTPVVAASKEAPKAQTAQPADMFSDYGD